MNSRPSKSPDPVERLWDRYLELLSKQGIKESAQRWYVLRAEHYIKTFPDKKLARHTAEDISCYLEKMGHSARLLDWQFRQAVEAIRNLFLIITNRWEKEINWQYWLDSAQSLPPEHRTIAREKPPGQRTRVENLDLRSARERYGDIHSALITETRRRDYSISTEQTYAAWIMRFAAFHGQRDVRKLGGEDIVLFLEYLQGQAFETCARGIDERRSC